MAWEEILVSQFGVVIKIVGFGVRNTRALHDLLLDTAYS